MTDMLVYVLILLASAALVLQLLQLMRSRREASADFLDARFRALEASLERLERELRGEMARSRTESTEAARGDRVEQAASLERLGKVLSGQVAQLGSLQAQQFEAFGQHLSRLTINFDARAEQLRLSVENRLSAIQTDNAAKLEEMRQTVDEKLHATLEQRLGESFKLVSDRLEEVVAQLPAKVDAGVELGNAYLRQGRRKEAIAAYRGLLTQTKVPVEPSIATQLKTQIAAIEAAPKDATVEPMRNPWLE